MPRNTALEVAVARSGRPKYAVAADAGINASLFSAVLAGRHDPSPRVRAGICRALGLAEDELFAPRRSEGQLTG